ncbi:hypothetical protein K504DRAFT_464685 [Pleomassaria siparia CBS 279.74]|uniref:Uncharacterized protein n=1 Tax=Pleomassaria siparia CBS 279.74 TaxID=1314801 RepID=A0A6G1KJ11_9PLEO|nr:hypothetical protein K504DRAFT_464685 [Pleomassaria siparia CBS 279.74]
MAYKYFRLPLLSSKRLQRTQDLIISSSQLVSQGLHMRTRERRIAAPPVGSILHQQGPLPTSSSFSYHTPFTSSSLYIVAKKLSD